MGERHVLAGADQFRSLLDFIHDPLPTTEEKSNGTIRPDDAFFSFKWFSAHDGLLDPSASHFPIIRVDVIEVAVDGRLSLPRQEAEDSVQLIRPAHGIGHRKPLKAAEVPDLLGIRKLRFSHPQRIFPLLPLERERGGIGHHGDLPPMPTARPPWFAEVNSERPDYPFPIIE